MRICHSYSRWSDPKQSDGTSSNRQSDGRDNFLKTHGFQAGRVFTDDGKSGYQGDKQRDLKRFFAAIESGEVKAGDVFLVEALDRLGRRGIRKTKAILGEIWAKGIDVAILSPMEKIYRWDDENNFGNDVEIAAFAYSAFCESKRLSDKVKGFHAIARRDAYKGKTINSGAAPYWLTRKDGKFSVKSEAAKVVKYIFARTVEGMGGHQLVKELNERFPTIGKKKTWNQTYLGMILNDRRAIGEYQPHEIVNGKRTKIGEPIANYYPAVVSEKLWLQAQAARANRRVERGPSSQYINLFTGIVTHAIDRCHCHIYSYFQTRADGRKVVFRRLKSEHAQNKVQGASTETVDIHAFEHCVLGWLRELDFREFGDGRTSTALELKSLIESHAKKTAKLNALQQAITEDDTAVPLLVAAMKKVDEERQALKKQIDRLKVRADSPAEAIDHISRLEKLDNTPENRQKLREAIKRVVKQIVILPIKLGNLRRSPIACLIEIEFHNGSRREIVMRPNERVAIAFDSKNSPLLERKDLLKWKSKFASFVVGSLKLAK